MDIIIDTYKPEYIEAQMELGQKIRKDWPLGQQQSLEQLKQHYQHADFDPNQNFYVLKDDIVVGFVTTRIEGEMATLEFSL